MPPILERLRAWRNARVADPRFQAWAAAFPLTRPLVRAEAAALYDLVAGFVYSQAVAAAVALDLPEALAEGPATAAALAPRLGLPVDGAERLLMACAALRLADRLPDGRFALAQRGAALMGAAGVRDMVRHHNLFYADLADPVALLRGGADTALRRYWSYVGGANTHAMTAEEAAPYSALMAASQAMVAEETLATGALRGARHLVDVGGGEGAFLAAAAAADPALRVTLFDLPAVADRAIARFAALGLSGRAVAIGGSFRDDPVPPGADTLSLIRVLYDHDDDVVGRLLAAARAALPPGGRIVISEPMSGGARPSRVGDVYFAFYTLAMGTGRPRSPARIAELLRATGFDRVRVPRMRRPFVTQVVTARAA